MDRANQVPVRDLPPSVSITYTALAEHGDVPLAIVHHRAITKSITLDCYGGKFPTSKGIEPPTKCTNQLHNSAALGVPKTRYTHE